MTTVCPHCGRPDAEPAEIVSRHATATGLTLWTRCRCRSLQIRIVDGAGERIVSRGQPLTPARLATP